MSLAEYFDRFVGAEGWGAEDASDGHTDWGQVGNDAFGSGVSEGDGHAAAQLQRGYLAQHPLLDQVEALAADVAPPPQTCTGRGRLVAANAWLGPKHTVTPLHHDPNHNMLCQVRRQALLRLCQSVG